MNDVPLEHTGAVSSFVEAGKVRENPRYMKLLREVFPIFFRGQLACFIVHLGLERLGEGDRKYLEVRQKITKLAL